MNNDLLNQPRNPHLIDSITNLLRSVIDGRTAIYVSVPITTGPRFLKWYANRGVNLDPASREYRDEHYRLVIQPNHEAARHRIAALRRTNTIVIDPTAFECPEWNQDEYRYFWGRVIERHVNAVVFLDGWQYSSGCSFEFLTATRYGIQTLNENGRQLDHQDGLALITSAIHEIKQYSLPPKSVEKMVSYLERMTGELHADAARLTEETTTPEKVDWAKLAARPTRINQPHFKDAILDELASVANVAQFVSFEPNVSLTQRFSHVRGFEPNFSFPSAESAITALLEMSSDGAVNVRSFRPELAKGEPLKYGLKNVDEVMAFLRQKAAEGKYTIVNETIDIHDGGVSGVALGQILEFSPNSTPQCVDKPGICALPRDIALRILENVYGFRPAIGFDMTTRVEFSLHPRKRGLRGEHTIIWELEDVGKTELTADVTWPNNFSRWLGDKTYGLLVADALGLAVPKTMVITRTVAPFTFGRQTETQETWIRTCPEVRAPGKYPTKYGWCDPFELMSEIDRCAEKDSEHVRIASVLAQEAVNPAYSGSVLTREDKQPEIEGVRGRGDDFMVGLVGPDSLPDEVIKAVKNLYNHACKRLGAVEMEWVYDGQTAWVVQLHKGRVAMATVDGTIYPGEAKCFHRFDAANGLDALRRLISTLQSSSDGIILIGDVGITSHFGDILRSARIPSRIERRI